MRLGRTRATAWTVCSAGVLAFSVAAAAWSGGLQAPKRSIKDGVYSEAQAERGKAQYAQHCSSCHADNLQGSAEGPGLVGEGFLSGWVDLSVNDLFERTRVSMPQDRPGQLSRGAYADIITYLFKVNTFPSGADELKPEAAAMSQIRIVSMVQPEQAAEHDRPKAGVERRNH